MLDVARLPEELVKAFSDTHDITVRVARDIMPLAGDPQAFVKMRDEADRIAEQRSREGLNLSGPQVAKRLVKATVAPLPTPAGAMEVTGKGATVRLRSTKPSGGGPTTKFPAQPGARPAGVPNPIDD